MYNYSMGVHTILFNFCGNLHSPESKSQWKCSQNDKYYVKDNHEFRIV
ncbi:MAG: hypothetical protein IPP43_05895 [Chitinophagaceae bacterium]|nr:hypothetical protein [Chitinophagaceae bacterium]